MGGEEREREERKGRREEGGERGEIAEQRAEDERGGECKGGRRRKPLGGDWFLVETAYECREDSWTRGTQTVGERKEEKRTESNRGRT